MAIAIANFSPPGAAWKNGYFKLNKAKSFLLLSLNLPISCFFSFSLASAFEEMNAVDNPIPAKELFLRKFLLDDLLS
ncbi:hypothetical protein RHP49_10700 [Flavobacteriaceae bacterium HL-DH10]|uniref:Uncharacterized protein n=1 Tax=Thalassobellus suaedae TaxID=3074124 RepID=A0ABY9Y097_9FLAO|nr:hypothetical protein RHP49_10700 [Flavobacteriaceae bacterium HL-DH10]